MTSKNILIISFIFVSTLFIIFNLIKDPKRSLFPRLRNLYNRDKLREVPDILPRRSSNYTVNSTIKEIPPWISCAPAKSKIAIWSIAITAGMAERASVLALSIRETWDKSYPEPDLRLMIIENTKQDEGWQEPAVLDSKARAKLEKVGWGLCSLEMPDYMKKQTIPQYTLSHSKLFVWNMTQYDSVLWLDSDSVVAHSLHTIFLKVDGLMSPTDTSPGPRLGISYDKDYYGYFLDHGRYPPLDIRFYADSNSGVFLIKPDKEEFLYQLNLKNADTIYPPTSEGSDQGFINALYKYERLDLGLENNVLINYVLDSKYEPYLGNLSVNVWQFTGDKKDTLCKAKEMSAKLKEACSLYQKYAEKLIS